MKTQPQSIIEFFDIKLTEVSSLEQEGTERNEEYVHVNIKTNL